jgi:malonyl-CoA/methylmalonyl-CoA synthetase
MESNAHLPPGAAPDLLAEGNLARAIVAAWQERPLLRDLDGTWLGGSELEVRSARIAGRLLGAGLAPADRVILCAGTSAALVCAYIGVLRAGLVAVPVNPAYTRGEVERLVRAAGPAAALVDDDTRAGWVRAAAPGIKLGGIDLAGLPGPARSAAPDARLDAAASGDPALLLYTSGTTGVPKGALLSHGNLLSSARAVGLAWRWSAEDRLLLTLPLFHMHGLGVGINGGLVAGSQVVLRPGFDVLDVAERAGEGITMFFGVPAMYQRLAARGGPVATLAGLRLLVSGSAPLPPALAETVKAATGQIPLERYGMTETVMITSNLIDGPRKPGMVGLPLPGVSLRLVAGGEVQVRGPNVLAGYDGRPDADAEAFTADGWFRTGDLGELDADGHLRLVGRSKELIISGGFNVHPREVEEALSEFPGVREVAVIGRPSEQWGEAVTAVVAASEEGGPVDPAALRRFAASRLAPYKVPKAIEFVDALPRNALGKVVRREL